jgi:uncharacterized protein (DUF1330 family)
MAAYVILNVDVTDPARYGEYVKAAGASVARYGGRYLVRGGRAERLEGAVEPKRVVVLEFESYDRARAWWSSTEYAGPKTMRQSAAHTEMVLVEGV